jgi:hypothetical protein
METFNTSDSFVSAVFVHSALFEGNDLIDKPTLVASRGQFIKHPGLTLRSTIFLQADCGGIVATAEAGKHFAYSESELSRYVEQSAVSDLSTSAFEARRIMGLTCSGGASGHYTHDLSVEGGFLLPKASTFRNRAEFYLEGRVRMRDAWDLFSSGILVEAPTSGWFLTNQDRIPFVALPFRGLTDEESAEIEEAVLSQDEVYLERILPDAEENTDPYDYRILARIPVTDHQSPGQSLNRYVGLMDIPDNAKRSPEEFASDVDGVISVEKPTEGMVY